MILLRQLIISVFKLLFIQRLLQMQLVRYVIAAGTAFTVDVAVYFIMLHFFISDKIITVFNTPIILRAAMLSLVVSFTCGLVTNFYMSNLFVFKAMDSRTNTHFARFVLVAMVTFVGNYFLMRFFIEALHLYPTVARIVAACVFAMFSFTMHKFFSFR
ncbi:MAG: GtrA family protein [Bacteroidia bacterium]|nr:GtrA family protein [Bacteroidia bacterium]